MPKRSRKAQVTATDDERDTLGAQLIAYDADLERLLDGQRPPEAEEPPEPQTPPKA